MEGGLTTVLLLLAGSLAAVALFKSMGLPALMGYLLVGVAVGPHALGLMPEEGGAAVLAEFGVVFLKDLINGCIGHSFISVYYTFRNSVINNFTLFIYFHKTCHC